MSAQKFDASEEADQNTENTNWNVENLDYDRRNVIMILQRIETARDEAKDFSRRSLTSDPRVKRYIGSTTLHKCCQEPDGNWHSVKESAFHAIVDHMSEKGLLHKADRRKLVVNEADHLFYAVTDFLEVDRKNEETIKRKLPGLFLSYRPSLIDRSCVVIGLVHIAVDPKTTALTANEYQWYRPDPTRKQRHQIFSGYLWRKRRKYLFVDRDSSSKFIRTSILTEMYVEDSVSIALEGTTTGIFGPRVYTARVHMERYWDPQDKVDYRALSMRGEPIPAVNSILENNTGLWRFGDDNGVNGAGKEISVPPSILYAVNPAEAGNLNFY